MNYTKLITRTIVAFLLCLALNKLWYSDSRIDKTRQDKNQDLFWRKGNEVPSVRDFVNKLQMPLEGNLSPNDLPERPMVKIVAPVIPLRIVHLDLKGAAPKVKYLEQIFPLLSILGADGVLIEYEDMFPYDKDLAILRSPHAYSLEDIERIKKISKLNKLELIPLVQVFGHLEFVLKYEQYHHLREVKEFPNSLNPRHPESVALVQAMVTQVMDVHPEARWLHMGADEVRCLGQGQDPKGQEEDVGKLFLNHVTKMARFISERRPGLEVIMWDDMLRKINPMTIRDSGLQNWTVPAIWRYASELDTAWVDGLITSYQTAGFKGVWFASAFKGASGIDQQWTPLNHHLQNHLGWTEVMRSMPKYRSITLQGILLTGWQRYEHYTVLCELLPVAIPSLAICLQSLKKGLFGAKEKAEVRRTIGCEVDLEKDLCQGSGAFSGAEIYHGVLHIQTNLKQEVDDLMKHNHLRGAFSPYHRRYHFANPRNIGFFKRKLNNLLKKWETYIQDFRTEMETIYFADTIEEWMEEYVNPHLDQLREVSRDAEQIAKLNGRPKSSKI